MALPRLSRGRRAFAALTAVAVIVIAITTIQLWPSAARGEITSSWRSTTQRVLADSTVAESPFPVLQLPRDKKSLYELSAAIVVGSRSGSGAVTVTVRDQFLTLARARWSDEQQLFDDPDDGAPLMVTWFALRAFEATHRLGDVSAAHMQAIAGRAAAGLTDASVPDAIERIHAFRVARFVADHGPGEAAATASAALARSAAALPCAPTADDIDLWGATAEMVTASGRSCPTTGAARAAFETAVRALDVKMERSPSRVDVAMVATLEGLQAVATAYALPAVDLGRAVGAVHKALGGDLLEEHPIALLTASDALAAAKLPTRLGSRAGNDLRFVLRWGGGATNYQPDAQLFVLDALSLDMLPGDPTLGQLSAMVDWDKVRGLDRLVLATHLAPDRIRSADFTVAIEDAKQQRLRNPSQQGAAQPSAGGSVPKQTTLDPVTRRAMAVIAQAASVHHEPCAGPLATWMGSVVGLIDKDSGDVATAASNPLLQVDRTLAYAASCPPLRARAGLLRADVRARAVELDRAASAAGRSGRLDILELWSTTELVCSAGLKPQISAVDAEHWISDQLRPEGGISGDGEAFSLWRTYAALRSERLLSGACAAAGRAGAG